MSSRAETLLLAALGQLRQKPPDSASREDKKRYSEEMSAGIALALAEELRQRGLRGARPSGPGDLDGSGAERRLAGGIGAKKVDISWATEESGLLLGISVKTINFRDRRSRNFQKNLTNRRGDMLIEAVTLHRRFPYAVLVGLLFLDRAARDDGTDRRRSTVENAFPRLRLFTGRQDPLGRDEQFERLYLLLVGTSPTGPTLECFHVSDPDVRVDLSPALDQIVDLVAERNFDFYETTDGRIRRTG